ncbi:hypothetical protein NC652_028140 [Populus alba x Populus x berolinensis]|nr:hypothetical protein NC652_028140 [Populus alba x Populus x berolinensis]
MEDFIFRGFLSSSLLLSLYVVFRVAHTFWLKPRSQEKRLRKQGIRGTSYKLLNGDMKEFARSSKEARSRPIALNQEIAPRVLPFFYKMVQIYGKVSLCWMGTRPSLLLADPELVRLVLTDTSGHIVKQPRNALVGLLYLGVSTLEGDKWANRRRLMTPAFHAERLRGMIPAFSACCCDLVQRWKKLAGPQGSCELDVASEFNILASDVIARAAFGSSYEEGKEIFDLQKDQVILALEAFYSIYFPGLRFIPSKKNKKRYSIDREIKAALRNIIHKKERAMQNGDSGDADLLGLLLQGRDDADNDMKIEDVIEECKLFFFAGQETTANLLTWTLIVLSIHPVWQEKAREEVLQICGKRTPDIDSIKQLRIVSMILNEVLRLYPPVNLVYRHTLKETSIQGMSIPAGVDLLLPFLFLHYDPEYWGDNAEEFKPERFSEGVSKASKDEIAFYPFGWGPRFCLGQNFALTEAKMALTMILQNFWFELSPSYTHAPCNFAEAAVSNKRTKMEDFIFRGFLSSSLLLSLYVVFRVAHTFWLKPKSQEKRLRKQGIRGTSYKLLNGDKKEFARSSKEARSRPIALNQEIAPRVLPFFYKMVQIYGKVSLCWMGTRPSLLLADPELVRLVLTDTSGHIIKPPRNALVGLLQLGVSTLEGDKWAKRRRLMTPAFHAERLRGMIPAFSACCCDLVQRWKKLAGPQGSCELDVANEFNILASDVIARAAFGSSYEEGKKIFDLQKDQVILVLEAFYSIYFPGLRFIPSKKNKKRYSIDREIKAALRNIIHKKERAMQNGDSGDADLLGLLLQGRDDADNDMKIEDVIEECKLFFFAGQETTANLLTWTLIVLSIHPVWQEKAREEVLQICGNRAPDIDSIKQLRIVSMILNEVLRLYPPVNLLYRHTLKETSIRGMSIPAGVDILLPFLFLHYDPEYWGDNAEEFKPERFSEGVSKASKDEIAFYPFGWGPRFCLGQNFALTEAKMALTMILQNFWFELSPSYTHAPCNVITLQPQHGAPIILHQL